MKSKLKNAVSFSEVIDIRAATEVILRIQDFAIDLYEAEGTESLIAHEEANKLIFSKPFYALSGCTVAQWVAKGGSEKKAFEVIKDLISEAIKESHKEEEIKAVMAKVLMK